MQVRGLALRLRSGVLVVLSLVQLLNLVLILFLFGPEFFGRVEGNFALRGVVSRLFRLHSFFLYSLGNSLALLQAVDVAALAVFLEGEFGGYVDGLVLRQRLVSLVFEFRNDGARIDFEFDCRFDQRRVKLHHFFLSVVHEMLLDEVTGVV